MEGTGTRDFYYMFEKKWSSLHFVTVRFVTENAMMTTLYQTCSKNHESLCGSSLWIRLKKGKKESGGTVSRGWVYVTRG